MSSLRRLLLVLTLAAAVTIWPSRSEAMPAFARKYGFNCGMCHSTWPRLNDFGQKYRMNGYQIPGDEAREKTILELGGSPLAMRTKAGYTSDSFSPEGAESETNQFQVNGLDVLAGGVLGFNKSFFLAYLPQIEGGSGVEPQTGEVEQASVVFSRLRSTWLNGRIGRFEAAYLPFSRLRSMTLSPYEIYSFNGSPDLSALGTRGSYNPFSLADTADGIEISGWGRCPWQYALGIANGSRGNNQDDSPSDIYLRGAYIFGQGFGQTAGQRLGATVYFGRARALVLGTRHSFRRLGLDANLNRGPYNIELQLIQGRDSGAFNVFNPGERYKFSGGFVQLNRFAEESAAFLRYDWVNTPSADNHDISRITVGWRQHLDHPLMLQLEYSHRKVDEGAGPGSDLTENFAAARLDWAF
ncbi:MAG TPA: hypothetical protein VMX94_01195 [Armatimonadota bacterium]|nr:hypothetical protein [Armatimonadota bacterium]